MALVNVFHDHFAYALDLLPASTRIHITLSASTHFTYKLCSHKWVKYFINQISYYYFLLLILSLIHFIDTFLLFVGLKPVYIGVNCFARVDYVTQQAVIMC